MNRHTPARAMKVSKDEADEPVDSINVSIDIRMDTTCSCQSGVSVEREFLQGTYRRCKVEFECQSTRTPW